MNPAKEPLDRIDRHLLTLLQKDARMSNKELAAAVGLAPSSCHGRVQRLIESGVLRGFHAEVDPAALGIALQAIVAVRLRGNPADRIQRFVQEVGSLAEVVEVFHVAGRNDLLLHIAVRDVEHMRELVMEKLSSQSAVDGLESALIYHHSSSPGLPDLVDHT